MMSGRLQPNARSYAHHGPFGPVAFDPSQLPGLLLWLDADKGITLNGSNISAWADQSPSGANLVQGTAANQPQLIASAVNGHAAVQSNDANDYVDDSSKPDFSNLTKYHAWWVFKASSSTLNQLAWGANGFVNDGLGLQYYDNALGVAQLGLLTYVTASNYGKYVMTEHSNYHIHEAQFDGSQSGNAARLKAWLDAASQTLAFTGTIPSTLGASQTGFRIGNSVVSFLGLTAAVVVYNRVLSDAERTQLGQYLTQRYALTTGY